MKTLITIYAAVVIALAATFTYTSLAINERVQQTMTTEELQPAAKVKPNFTDTVSGETLQPAAKVSPNFTDTVSGEKLQGN